MVTAGGGGARGDAAGLMHSVLWAGLSPVEESWPITAPSASFSEAASFPQPAEPRDGTRYDVRVELMVALAGALGWAPHRTHKGGVSETVPLNPISFPLTHKPSNRNLKPTLLQKTKRESKS